MKKYHLTRKGIKCVLGICVAAAMILGFCLSFSVVYHMGKQRIFAMTLDEAERLVNEAEKQSESAGLTTQTNENLLPEQNTLPSAEEEIVLPLHILFEEDIACLNREVFPKLNSFAGLARQRESERVRIAGHAAFSSDEFAGNSLSYLRAKAVKEYLIHCGVAETRIDVEANGYRNPIDTSDVTSFRNRRVELSFD